MLDINNYELSENNMESPEITNIARNDIGIIGISCRIGKMNNPDEYWEALCRGRDCIAEFPENRKNDIDESIEYCGPKSSSMVYGKGCYLENVDRFDYKFFNLSKNPQIWSRVTVWVGV